MFKFELGQKVKDTITGFEGVVIAQIKWLNGCVRYHVQSKKRTAEGKPIDDTIDEQQLVSTEKPPKVKKSDKGGPMPEIRKFNNRILKR